MGKLRLSDLKIWQKLALIVFLMGVPMTFIVYSYISEKNTNIAFSQKEIYGVAYLKPLYPVYFDMTLHRNLTILVKSGDRAREAALAAIEGRINAKLAEVAAVDQRYGGGNKFDGKNRLLDDQLDTTKSFEIVKKDWESLQNGVRGLDAKAAADRHDALIANVITLITRVADNSNLTLDPDLDTYYLMDSVTTKLPAAAQSLSLLYGGGIAVAAQKQIATETRFELSSYRAQLQANIDAVKAGLGKGGKGFRENGDLEKEIAPKTDALDAAINGVAQMTDQSLLKVEKIDMAPVSYFDGGRKAHEEIQGFYETALDKLNELLDKRVSGFVAQRTTNLSALFLALAVALVAIYFLSRLITAQIVDIRKVFQEVEAGNYKSRATVMGEDELGRLANALNFLLDNTLKLIQSREERDQIQSSVRKLLMEVSDVAQGDLTVEAEVTADMTGAIADSFNFMIGELRRVISDVQETTVQVGSAASEIQATAENLAQGSEMQATQIVETSAAIDEMTVSIQQVSENALLSASVAEQARNNARQGTQAVSKTIEGMNAIRQQVQESAKRIKRLGESSQEIGEIVQLIGDIADRTSILALNASIQAAMAGEAGRGFAVVASEVERLAERSAEATKRISTLIKSIQTETNEAVAAMESTTREVVVGSNLANEADTALAQIESVSNRLAELIQSISLSSKQQARGSESIAKAMNEISDVIQQTAAGTKQASVSIRNLTDLADALRSSVSAFKLPASVNGTNGLRRR
jgi:methyl-accepting chemotaxis protein